MDFGAPGGTQQVSRGVRVKSWIPTDKHAGFGSAAPRGEAFFQAIYPGSLQRINLGEAPWKAAGPKAWQENPPNRKALIFLALGMASEERLLHNSLVLPHPPSGFKTSQPALNPSLDLSPDPGSAELPLESWRVPKFAAMAATPPNPVWVPSVESVPVGKSLPPL